MEENGSNYNAELIREYSGQIKELYDRLQLLRTTEARVIEMLRIAGADVEKAIALLETEHE